MDNKYYLVDNEPVIVADSDEEGFKKNFPKAIEGKAYLNGKDTVVLNPNDEVGFLKNYPDAKFLGGEVKKKDSTISEDYPNGSENVDVSESNSTSKNKFDTSKIYNGSVGNNPAFATDMAEQKFHNDLRNKQQAPEWHDSFDTPEQNAVAKKLQSSIDNTGNNYKLAVDTYNKNEEAKQKLSNDYNNPAIPADAKEQIKNQYHDLEVKNNYIKADATKLNVQQLQLHKEKSDILQQKQNIDDLKYNDSSHPLDAAGNLVTGAWNGMIPAVAQSLGAITKLAGDVAVGGMVQPVKDAANDYFTKAIDEAKTPEEKSQLTKAHEVYNTAITPVTEILGDKLKQFGKDAEIDADKLGFHPDKHELATSVGGLLGTVAQIAGGTQALGLAAKGAQVLTAATFGASAANTAYDKAEKAGLTGADKTNYVLANAVVSGAMAYLPAGKVIEGTVGKTLASDIMNSTLKDIKDNGLTGDGIFNVVQKTFKEKAVDLAKHTAKSYAEGAAFGLAQGTANYAIDKTTNAIEGNNNLEADPSDILKSTKDMAMGIGVVAPFLHILGKSNETSAYNKFTDLYKDPVEFKKFNELLDSKLQSGQIKPEEHQNILNNIKAIGEADAKIPPIITNKKKRIEAINLIVQKNKLEADNNLINDHIQKTEPVFQNSLKEEVTANQKKIDGINSNLQLIAKGADRVEMKRRDLTPTTEIPKPEENFTPAINTKMVDPILSRINNAEYINENDLNDAADHLYGMIDKVEKTKLTPEQKKSTINLIEPLINKVENYEFRTKTENGTVTEGQTTLVPRKVKSTEKIPALEQSEGSPVTITTADGKQNPGYLKIKDGNYIVESGKGKIISLGEKAITDNGLKLPDPEKSENPITFDEDGKVTGITFETPKGDLITIKGHDKALDLAIQLRAEQIGDVPQLLFDQVYTEVTKPTTKEVLVNDGSEVKKETTDTGREETNTENNIAAKKIEPKQEEKPEEPTKVKEESPVEEKPLSKLQRADKRLADAKAALKAKLGGGLNMNIPFHALPEVIELIKAHIQRLGANFDEFYNEVSKEFDGVDIDKKALEEEYNKQVKEEEFRAGASNRALTEIANDLGLEQFEKGTRLDPEEYAERGKALLEGGADIEQIKKDWKKNGTINTDIISVASQHFIKLAKKIDKTLKEFGENSTEYKEAKKTADDFVKDYLQPMKTEWAGTGAALQGQVGLDTGSFYSMENAFKEKAKRDPTPKEVEQIKKLVKQVEDLTIERDEANNKLTDIIDKAFKEDEKNQKAKNTDKVAREYKKRTKEIEDIFENKKTDMVLQRIKEGREKGEKIDDIIDNLPDDLKPKSEEKIQQAKDTFNDIFDETPETPELISLIEKAQKQTENINKAKKAGKVVDAERLANEKKITDGQISNLQKALKKKINPKTYFIDHKGNAFSPREAKALWDYAKENYIDKGMDFDKMLMNVGMDTGLSADQVRNAFASPKNIKPIIEGRYTIQRKRNQAIEQAKRFVEDSNKDWLEKAIRAVPNFFFAKAIWGHGTVGLITHAGRNIFDPVGWKNYFNNFGNQYKFLLNKNAYEKAKTDLQNHPDFNKWKRAGLAIDPFKTTSEYEGIRKILGAGTLAGDRGFFALKTLRFAMAKAIYDKLPEIDKADPNTIKEIAANVNHATGTVTKDFGQAVKTLIFAPKLEASRWQSILVHPIKAANTFRKMAASTFTGKEVPISERVAAKQVAKKTGRSLATFAGLLLANQALLVATGSKHRINFTNPLDKDWLKFKVGDKTIDPTGGIVSSVHFLANLLAIPFETKQDLRGDSERDKIFENAGNYLTGKASPFMSTSFEAFTSHDFAGNSLPWSNKPPTHAYNHKLSWWEYGFTQSPIPISEGARDVYQSMEDAGVPRPTIEMIFSGIFSGFVSGFTGLQVKKDFPKHTSTSTIKDLDEKYAPKKVKDPLDDIDKKYGIK